MSIKLVFSYVTNITKNKQQFLSKPMYFVSLEMFSLSTNDSTYLMQPKLLLELNYILYFIIRIPGES